MNSWVVVSLICLTISGFILISESKSKSVDPYKVLGVERNASQREIQKAFHKLSLRYHPDKNKDKGAEEKFAEINNAYDILSDEEKRKKYDLYGDEKGSPVFEGGAPGGQGGYTHFTSGGPGNSHFTFDPNEWQSMGGGQRKSEYSFSFGSPSSSGNSFGFDLNDIFSGFFGGGVSGGGFGGSSSTRPQSSPSKSIRSLNSLVFKKEIVDQGLTWLLLSYLPSSKGYNELKSIVEEVSSQLDGALKAGSINCQKEQSLCKEIGVYPSKSARIFVYSYKTSDNKGSLVEYKDEWEAKSLKNFCQLQLPRFSKRVDVSRFDFTSTNVDVPRVLLLSTKKDTPVIWRALSGLYRRRIVFYDAEVRDISDPAVKKLGVDTLPAVVGWLPNGEKHVLKTGITVKDLKSAISELSGALDMFEEKTKKKQTGNLDAVCGEGTPVCVIGCYRSSKARSNLESILNTVSKKSLTRRQNQALSSGDSVSFSLLDASRNQEFLNSLDKSGFKSKDSVVVAYKPRKGKFAAFTGELTVDEVERFVGGVLNGDVQFSKIKKKAVLR